MYLSRNINKRALTLYLNDIVLIGKPGSRYYTMFKVLNCDKFLTNAK